MQLFFRRVAASSNKEGNPPASKTEIKASVLFFIVMDSSMYFVVFMSPLCASVSILNHRLS